MNIHEETVEREQHTGVQDRGITGHLEYENESPERMLGTVRNVTIAKKSEAAVRTAEKLSAVGRLAASIAHEINNPLESITNLLYLARNSSDHRDVSQYLDIADQELRRVSIISNQTLRFCRQSTHPTDAACKDILDSVLSIYQGRLSNSDIEVFRRERAKLPVNCFEAEIRQVLSNLIGNAIDAMRPGGGTLLLRTRHSTNWRTGAKGITLTVADTGTGISAQSLKRIFEPFFTTKGIGGTGLGLWVSEEIVQRHGGRLFVRSSQRPARSGTLFTLFLPFDGIAARYAAGQNVIVNGEGTQ